MKQSVAVTILLFCALFALPLFSLTSKWDGHEEDEERTTIEALPPGERDAAETLRVKLGDSVTEMTMGEYLQSVLRAEMPASFEQEALCAQAVAARTYTLYKITAGSNHADADICGDPACCQAFLTAERAAENWGKSAKNYEAKIDNAVALTDGMTMLYENRPILAVFHSSSSGKTRASGEVWKQDLPYLQSVESPEKGADIPNFYSRVSFSAEEFRSLVQKTHPEAELSGAMGTWITDVQSTGRNLVSSLVVGGVKMRGSELRSILSLRSASFEVELQGKELVFFVSGYGHGVGMSQYGANELAREGKSYREILEHYYTGVRIAPFTRTAKP